MKRKFVFFVAITAVLICLMAISASAATETINKVTYDLNTGNKTATVTSANKYCYLTEVIIPEKVTGSDGNEYTVTAIGKEAFRGNLNLMYISLPATITSIGEAAFLDCKNLVFVDFNDNQNKITANAYGIFRNCTSLKALCLPDGLTAIYDQFATNATALTAVYLPSNLEFVRGNKWAWDGPAFGNSPEMYLVNEKFSVRDENGNFYTASTFVPPKKPEVYYFPENLKAITGDHNTNENFKMDDSGMVTNTGLEDCGFYNLPNINSVLVLPESYQGYDDRELSTSGWKVAQFTDFRGDTIESGLFQNCGTEENPLTVVFLGKIDRVSMGRSGQSQYTTYVFANPANTGFENTKIGTSYDTSYATYSNQTEMYAVFCYANNSAGAKYKLSFEGSDSLNTYPVLKTELVEDASCHISSPRNNEIAKLPDCVTDMLINTFCFCGVPIETNVTVEGTKTNHNFNLEEGATKVKITYVNYLAKGNATIKCAKCDVTSKATAAPIIIEFKGFSTKINGDGLVISYLIDYTALDEYAKINKDSVQLGFVIAVKHLVSGELIDQSGNAAENVSKIPLVIWNESSSLEDDVRYNGAEMILTGFENGTVDVNGTETDIRDIEIYMAGFLIDANGVYYLNANGSSDSPNYTTYNVCSATN